MNFSKELSKCIEACHIASKVILEIYNSNCFNTEIKDDNSPVTKADKESNEIICKILKDNFPLYSILSEESIDDKTRLNNDYVWIIDPIDGTKDFIAKNDEFTINIALCYKKQIVLGIVYIPAKNIYYYAVKNNGSYKVANNETLKINVNSKSKDLTVLTSRFHLTDEEKRVIEKHNKIIKHIKTVGSSIKGCLIAEGLAEISYRFSDGTKEWDTAAMQLIVEEAGGLVVKHDKTPLKYNKEEVRNIGGYIICNKIENLLL